MKQKLKSLKVRMLLPVIMMTLFVVILLTALFSRAYIRMILKQEKEVNSIGFETISHAITPLIDTSISEVRSIMTDDRIESYARLQYDSAAKMVHARKNCVDYLREEIMRHDVIFGLLFMRKDGSLFGALPEGNFFFDDPDENPLPEAMRTQILETPLGQTVWLGPLPAAAIYGFENDKTGQSIMIAAWKSVNVSYGECFAMMLVDETIFKRLFAFLQSGKSVWHLFTEDQVEIFHTGPEACPDPEKLIGASNSEEIFYDENGRSLCAFSMQMASPAWTVVREVSMEDYEQVVRQVRQMVWVIAGVVFLIALGIYQPWLKQFTRQFDSLLIGIIRMGEGDLEPAPYEPLTIVEFQRMQQEINRTRIALKNQMDTIRRMEREQIEQENKKKEQARIAQELTLARQIQESALPHVFPAFPDRREFSIYASMTPAKEVGGDFYDFFLVDSDHLALVIADVSGKGIPAALFMMVSKTLIKNQLLMGLSPAEALNTVNQQLYERNESKMFVTVWAAVLEISTGRGLACNAGHENPGIRQAGGPFELISYKHNAFLGIIRKAKYVDRPFELKPGDSLFVYTDGVAEAHNDAEELFWNERLEAALNIDADAVPETLIGNVQGAVEAFVNGAEQYDDITMLALKYFGNDAPQHGAAHTGDEQKGAD